MHEVKISTRKSGFKLRKYVVKSRIVDIDLNRIFARVFHDDQLAHVKQTVEAYLMVFVFYDCPEIVLQCHVK